MSHFVFPDIRQRNSPFHVHLLSIDDEGSDPWSKTETVNQD